MRPSGGAPPSARFGTARCRFTTETGTPRRSIGAVAILVPDYDEAIDYFTGTLGFTLIEDTRLSEEKRWVLVSPGAGTSLLLARATGERQGVAIGNQSGGRVFLFLETDDFWRDYRTYLSRGVEFQEESRHEEYGMVAVFTDKFGNRWDLIERNSGVGVTAACGGRPPRKT